MISREQIIYLDNNATTQLDPAVIEEMLPFLTEYYGNPSSGYTFGRASAAGDRSGARARGGAARLRAGRDRFHQLRDGIEQRGGEFRAAARSGAGKHVVTTAVEHSATRRHCETLSKRGGPVTVVGVDGDGNLDLAELENAITPQTAIVTAMWANNETGVLFPVEKIAEIARRKRVLFHTDAIQTVGKIPIRLADSTINSLVALGAQAAWPQRASARFMSANDARSSHR